MQWEKRKEGIVSNIYKVCEKYISEKVDLNISED